MAEIQQVPPILTVVPVGGGYVVRASGDEGKRIGMLVLGQLGPASSVTFVSDTDVKVFTGNGKPPSVPRGTPPQTRLIQDEAAPPAPETVEGEYAEILAAQQEEERQQRAQEAFNRKSAVPAQEEEPQPTVRTREPRPEIPNSSCGRCDGIGKLEGGAVCPVCRGKGEVKAWGRGKSRNRAQVSFQDQAR